jgi:hypothetical protein
VSVSQNDSTASDMGRYENSPKLQIVNGTANLTYLSPPYDCCEYIDGTRYADERSHRYTFFFAILDGLWDV